MSTVIGGSDIEVEKIVIDGVGYDGDFDESGAVNVSDLIELYRGQNPQIHAKGAVQTGLALFSETLNSGGGGWMLCAGDGDSTGTDLVDAIWSIGGLGIQSSSKITAPEFIGDGSGLTNLPSPIDISETTIWSGNSSSGTLTMSESMANFDLISFWGVGEHQAMNIHTSAEFLASTNMLHTNGYLLSSYSSSHVWYKAGSNTTVVLGGQQNMRTIVGVNLT